MHNRRDKERTIYYHGYLGFGWIPLVIFWTIVALSFGFLSYSSGSSVYVFSVIPGIFGILFFLFMLFFFFRVFFGSSHHLHRHYWYGYSDIPEEILRRRYARGEINYKQFRKMLNDIRRGR